MIKKICLLFAGLLLCGGATAEHAGDITQRLLKETMDWGTAILKDESLDLDRKVDEFEKLIKKHCHTELMAYQVLGGARWKKMPEEQRAEFISTFIQMVTRSYYTKMDMSDISTTEILYGENEAVSSKKRVLRAVIKDEVSVYHVEYAFALINDEWGIYDLVIEGVSLLASYRSEYSDYLMQHSVEDLIVLLKEKALEAEASNN